jgi:hypothetical protein
VRDVLGESGTADEQLAWHSLDAAGIRGSIPSALRNRG